jgi:4-hydroxy-tetrahydrodipicolinate reductase
VSTLRLAIVGDGKMGRAIADLARERAFVVTAIVGATENVDGAGIDRARLGDAEVVIEFTEPAAAPANIVAAVRAGYPVVTGTTGWAAQLGDVAAQVDRAGGAVVHAPNFSIGVNLFLAIAAAPSGTAIALERVVAESLGRRIPTSSIRTGHVPGTHELTFDGPFEQIRLTHTARDRRVFADGALRAAAWVRGRRGVFTMRDVLELGPEIA